MHAFSICLGNNGGYMSVGGYNNKLHYKNETTHIVPYTTRTSSSYGVKIKGIKINN